MSDVFISYSRKDIAFARLLFETLQKGQVDAWIDWNRIPVGEDWWKEICEAIQAANVFMFIISQNSVGSQVCKKEITHALENNKRIIPILLDNLEPQVVGQFVPDLTKINWIIFQRGKYFAVQETDESGMARPEDEQVALAQEPQFQQALEKLGAAIRTDWEWVKTHTRLQVRALEWENNQRAPGYLLHGAELEEAEAWLSQAAQKDPQPTLLQAQYLATSRQEETKRQQEKLALEHKARQRQRLALWAVGLGLVIAVVLGVVAWGQRNKYQAETLVRATAQAEAVAESQQRATAEADAVSQANARATQQAIAEQQRDVAVARQLAMQSGEVRSSNIAVSLLLAAQSLRYSDTREGRNALAGVLQTHPGLLKVFDSGLPDIYLHNVAVSPDGKWIAAGDSSLGCNTCQILVWDTGSGRRVEKGFVEKALLEKLVFSPDGRLLISNNLDGVTTVRDFQTGATLYSTFTGHRNILAVSPDGKSVVTGGEGGITLRDLPELTQRNVFPICGDMVVFTPDSARFVSMCGGDNTISLWDVASGEQVGEPIQFSNGENQLKLKTVSLSPTSPYVAAVSGHTCEGSSYFLQACSIKTWMVDMETFTRMEDFSPLSQTVDKIVHDGIEYHSSFTPDGVFLVGVAGDTTAVWEIDWKLKMGFTQTGAPVTIGPVWDMQILPDGASFVTVDGSSDLKLWQVQNQSPFRQFLTYLGFTNPGWTDAGLFVPGTDKVTMLISDESSSLDEKSNPGEARIGLWDLSRQPVEHTFLEGQAFGVTGQAVSPDGRWLAIGQRDGEISLWDIPARRRAATLQPAAQVDDLQSHMITTLTFSPDSRSLVVGEPDGRILLFDVTQPAGEALVYPVEFPDINYVRSVTYAIAGQYIAASVMYSPGGKGSDDLILLIEAATGKVVQTFSPPEGYYWCTLRVPPAGDVMAASCNGKIWFYRLPSFDPISPSISTGQGELSDFAFSPNGKLLVTLEDGTLNDSTLKLWDFESKQLIVTLDSNSFGKLSFSPDGKLLYAGSMFNDEGLSVWHLDALEWIARACSLANRNLTQEEWNYYLQNLAYEKTCQGMP
jgi:WD40 repeat protein